ncbi:hypothetical protein FO519_004791 [Halicephalobus sp. NKZ332]|nr:hypothetical protein FO519_004791 [Halicephalobus sp. NKZ332]
MDFLDESVSALDQTTDLLLSNTEDFPPTEVLNFIQELIEKLTQNSSRGVYLSSNSPWGKNLLTLISRLLQTFNIEEKYVVLCFELSAGAIGLLGTRWFSSENKFPLLLCSLASGRLRIVMEEPEKIQLSLLIPLLTILEFSMDAVEDSNFFNDEDATKISYHVKEAASFLLDYITECEKSEKKIPKEVLLPIYKFICTFLSIGGAELLSEESINNAAGTLMTVAEEALEELDHTTAGMLIYNLPSIKKLPKSTLKLILDYLVRARISGDPSDVVASQVVSVLEQLNGRKDFFQEEDRKILIEKAREIKDEKLEQLGKSL